MEIKLDEELIESERVGGGGRGGGGGKLITAHIMESSCQQHPSQNFPNPFI